MAETVEGQPVGCIFAQFTSPGGEATGPQIEIPLDLNTKKLNGVINELLGNERSEPYSFYINDQEVAGTLELALDEQCLSTEDVIKIIYQPQATFRVVAVTRCSGTLPGHTEAILCVAFSPDCQRLLTGSGDATLRIWDLKTETPIVTLKGHKNWVLCCAVSPDGTLAASGSMDKTARIWDFKTGASMGGPLSGHSKWITSLAWEPIHASADGQSRRMVTASKDASLKVWDARTGRMEFTMTGHMSSVTSVRWGGQGLIFSGSEDRTIKVWDPIKGILCRSLDGHAHWVNHIALSTDHAMRNAPPNPKQAALSPQQRYDDALGGDGVERMVSASDDHTMYLWEPSKSKKPICRMTGHVQPINHVSFSPNGRLIASASFDKAIRIWNGVTGKYLATLRGHVGAVYQVAWSSDSRLLVSASKDSTIKLWDVEQGSKTFGKLKVDLPGHADEVFAVDWSSDGSRVASGSKDCSLKLWRY
eukprot:CAMPEP_0180139066 /NCGR_PEP_ID=MMETSP0986-20121125/13309_1 /TAXON_ID=697907 /ORGANISM="non described non described, Strain CCMP2293" /LENGTH=475 /DNA_ID=CAMNT_0022081093 /DNA_START=19 /DNA_END=1446 /DNA_ORIENTATION=-